MTALNILQRLKGVDLQELSPLQRILLITDGTLTEILEAHFLEPIELVKLSQRRFPAGTDILPFRAEAEEPVLERKINLRGARSGRKYVYAESLLLPERLSPQFRDELIESDIPLGRLWHKHRLETYKELVDIDCRGAGAHAPFLDCFADSRILTRTYNVMSLGQLLMRISEYFRVDGALCTDFDMSETSHSNAGR